MRLDEDSCAKLELFFREFLRDDNVRLPRMRFYTGPVAHWVTRAGRIGALTLGRRVFVAPSMLSRENGLARMSGRLLAHEVAHVLQYERVGTARFLLRYLQEYFAGLWRAGNLDAGSRMGAYLDISFEREARTAEREFMSWPTRVNATPQKRAHRHGASSPAGPSTPTIPPSR